MYLACRMQSNIVFIIRQFNYHNFNYQSAHIHIVKQIFQYLKMNIFGIIWKKDFISYWDQESKYRSFEIIRYINHNYVGDIDN